MARRKIARSGRLCWCHSVRSRTHRAGMTARAACLLLNDPLLALTLQGIVHCHPRFRTRFRFKGDTRRRLISFEADIPDIHVHRFQVQSCILIQVVHDSFANGFFALRGSVASDHGDSE
jgi:hypothetical protein